LSCTLEFCESSTGETDVLRILIKRIGFLDFIHRLVSQEQTKFKKLKIIDKGLKPK